MALVDTFRYRISATFYLCKTVRGSRVHVCVCMCVCACVCHSAYAPFIASLVTNEYYVNLVHTDSHVGLHVEAFMRAWCIHVVLLFVVPVHGQ